MATPRVSRILARKTAKVRLQAQRLLDALHVEFNWHAFIAAVRTASACRADLPPDIAKHWRNRMAWAEALASSQGPSPSKDALSVLHLEPVLRFYWTFRDGTGDVERGLGRFKAMQDSHTGAAESDISFPEMCLELHQEGPQHEAEVAAQAPREGAPLWLTPFSRHCAQLWAARFGRRFACQKERSDTGARRPERLQGTFKAVKKCHKVATTKLLRLAALDEQDAEAATMRHTILGFRRKLLDDKEGLAPIAGEKLRNFRNTTERRLEEKTQLRVWTGFAAAPIKMRRRGAAALSSSVQMERAKRFAAKASSASAPSRGKASASKSKSNASASSRGKAASSSASAAPKAAAGMKGAAAAGGTKRAAPMVGGSADKEKVQFRFVRPPPLIANSRQASESSRWPARKAAAA